MSAWISVISLTPSLQASAKLICEMGARWAGHYCHLEHRA